MEGKQKVNYCRIRVNFADDNQATKPTKRLIITEYYDTLTNMFMGSAVSGSCLDIAVLNPQPMINREKKSVEITVECVWDFSAGFISTDQPGTRIVIRGLEFEDDNEQPLLCAIKVETVGCPLPHSFIPIWGRPQLEICAEADADIDLEIVDGGRLPKDVLYKTKKILLQADNLCLYGDSIGYTADSDISVREVGDRYSLWLKGSNFQIEGIETVEVSEVRMSSSCPLKIGVKEGWTRKEGKGEPESRRTRRNGFRWWVCGLFLFLWLVSMTVFPILYHDKMWPKLTAEQVNGGDRRAEQTSLVDKGEYWLNYWMISKGEPTEQWMEAAGSLSSNGAMPNGRLGSNAKNESQTNRPIDSTKGYGLTCLWFVLSLILYLGLYLLSVCALVLSVRELLRQYTLDKLIDEALEAVKVLRAEKDEKSRKKLRDRILNKLVSTYLGENSDE